MLSFQEFFNACSGTWTTERIYHLLAQGQIERSYTEFRVQVLDRSDKQAILTIAGMFGTAPANPEPQPDSIATRVDQWPGFAIAFDTRSETGETVSMSLQSLFIPEADLPAALFPSDSPALPIAAEVSGEPGSEVIRGFYLRDQGYNEAGAIGGRFTYQPTRQTLEMTTYYRRSVAVDQMRFVAPNMRLRTIITYQRPPLDAVDQTPRQIDLIGFGVEHRRSDT